MKTILRFDLHFQGTTPAEWPSAKTFKPFACNPTVAGAVATALGTAGAYGLNVTGTIEAEVVSEIHGAEYVAPPVPDSTDKAAEHTAAKAKAKP